MVNFESATREAWRSETRFVSKPARRVTDHGTHEEVVFIEDKTQDGGRTHAGKRPAIQKVGTLSVWMRRSTETHLAEKMKGKKEGVPLGQKKDKDFTCGES